MPYYMTQWTYKDPVFKALLKEPQDRSEVVSKAIEAFGGKLHQFFFAYGEYDGVVICEFADNETAAAFLMTVGAGGAVSSLRTTILMTSEEAVRAMSRARDAASAYKPPG